MAESIWQRVRTWWRGEAIQAPLSPEQVEAIIAQRTPYERALDRLGDLQDLGCERGLSVREQTEYTRLDNAVKAYEAMSPAQTAREAVWDALSAEEHQARDREAYESRGSDPRVEAAQEQLFAQQREEGEWIGWHEPRHVAAGENGESGAREVEYPTQYAGMMGSAPERLEIDMSDTEMGQRWQDQLAAFDARLGALAQEQTAHQQHHEQGMRY
jgi:hypothetical protein